MSLDTSLVAQHTTENAKVFKKFAPIYDLVELIVGGIRRDMARDVPANAYVLDVACGTGTQAALLARQGHRVVGIDLSADMLGKARKKRHGLPNLEFVEKDAASTGYAAGSFDVAMISFGLHDMPEVIAMAVLQEMKRVTKPGGRLYILDYGKPSNPLVFGAGRLVCGTWESDHYRDFISKGIDYYLAGSNVQVTRRQAFLSGIIELTVIDLRP